MDSQCDYDKTLTLIYSNCFSTS